MDLEHPYLDELVDFHGHLCPGLAIGYRATLAGLERLRGSRARDEELVAIVENDSCSVDAVQFLAGATFGKGNLIFRDWGKQVFTFARRDSGDAVRVALRVSALEQGAGPSGDSAGSAGNSGPGDMDEKQRRADYILNAPVDELFDIRESSIELPPMARIHKSVTCDRCGEPVMKTRITEIGGGRYCPDCAGSVQA